MTRGGLDHNQPKNSADQLEFGNPQSEDLFEQSMTL
jgi:hypothetical protein